MPPRPQIAPTEDWRQIELLARSAGQRTYELIRPVVLFGQSPAERAAEYAALFAAAGFRFIGFTPSAVGTGVFAGVAA